MDGEFKQPVFTLFHKRVLPKLEAFLERGDRKIILLYKECVTEYVDFSDSPNCFVNLNTPEELTPIRNASIMKDSKQRPNLFLLLSVLLLIAASQAKRPYLKPCYLCDLMRV